MSQIFCKNWWSKPDKVHPSSRLQLHILRLFRNYCLHSLRAVPMAHDNVHILAVKSIVWETHCLLPHLPIPLICTLPPLLFGTRAWRAFNCALNVTFMHQPCFQPLDFDLQSLEMMLYVCWACALCVKIGCYFQVKHFLLGRNSLKM